MEVKIANAYLEAPHYIKDEQVLNFIHPSLLDFKRLRTSVAVASNIIKSIREVERAIKEFHDVRMSICESLCEKEEAGKPKTDAGKYVFSEGGQKEFDEKFRELLNTATVLNIHPVKGSDIASVEGVSIIGYDTLLRHGFIVD